MDEDSAANYMPRVKNHRWRKLHGGYPLDQTEPASNTSREQFSQRMWMLNWVACQSWARHSRSTIRAACAMQRLNNWIPFGLCNACPSLAITPSLKIIGLRATWKAVLPYAKRHVLRLSLIP